MLTTKTEAALIMTSSSAGAAAAASPDDDTNNIQELWMTAHTLHHYSPTFQKVFTCSELALRVVHDGLMRQKEEEGAHSQQRMDHAWTAALAIYIQHHKTIKVRAFSLVKNFSFYSYLNRFFNWLSLAPFLS